MDNIILKGDSIPFLLSLTAYLHRNFPWKIGPLSYFIGLHATRNDNTLHLIQSKCITNLLLRTKMHEAKTYPAPIIYRKQLCIIDEYSMLDSTL